MNKIRKYIKEAEKYFCDIYLAFDPHHYVFQGINFKIISVK